MLSRQSAATVGDAFADWFKAVGVERHALHDFLFTRDYPDWVYEASKRLRTPRLVKEWVMHLQTGRSIDNIADAAKRRSMGQAILRRLAEDILNELRVAKAQKPWSWDWERKPLDKRLESHLKLDGYLYKDGKLHAPESDVLDTAEASGVLETLYADLRLAEQATAFHCLKQSEEHWHNRKWDDCIANARRFLECVLTEVACAHSSKSTGNSLPQKKPFEIRDYLEKAGLMETKEKETLAKEYGLMSETGSHPYIAEQDQARLLRQIALIWAQFVLLRWQGFLAAKP
jgi:hypothetical protein